MKTKLTTQQLAQEKADVAAVRKLLGELFQKQSLVSFNDRRQSFRRLKFWQVKITTAQLDLLNYKNYICLQLQ